MYIAIDVGGTSTRVASTDKLSKVKDLKKISFKNTHNFNKDYGRIVREIKNYSKEIKAIGIGFPGDLKNKNTIVYDANHNREWEGKPFLKAFCNTFNCSVWMANDGEVAALGTAFFAEGKNKNFDYITWGTGIGGAKVVKKNSKVISTKLNWTKYFEDWEEKCGGEKIMQRYGKGGDKLSDSEWSNVMEDFYEGLLRFIKKRKPKLVVFGGGISNKQKSRLLALQTRLDKDLKVSPKLKISKLGEDTGLYGAFALIKNKLQL